jgi:dethiobiotin synthetase
MSKGIFITGTGTDIGKTYVTALLVKKMRQAGYDNGYYKAAISGAATVAASDAGYVNKIAGINEAEDLILSYLYQEAVSPHLAARINNRPICREKILADYAHVCALYPYVTVEGSGGIICPIRHDEKDHYLLEDVINWLHLPVLIISRSGLGSINEAVLTAFYLKQKGFRTKGLILNHYQGGLMEEDNRRMIEELTGLKVWALVRDGDQELDLDVDQLKALYEEI